jgi:ATP-dependent helicase/nuclease subunit A
MAEPRDACQRRMIEERLDVSMLVEAGAGSGKTTSLVSRMLALIGSGACTVDTMAAVTFTRKAAAELQGRFQIALEEKIKSEEHEELRRRYETALQDLHLLFSGTIHSFCARLLRERPIEARLDPDFQELEEEENVLLRDRCWQEFLETLLVEGRPEVEQLVELGLQPADLEETYRAICLYPEVEPVRQKLDRPDFREGKAHLRSYLKEALKHLPARAPEKGRDDLQRCLRTVRLRMRHLDIEEDRNFIRVMEALDRSVKATQNRWPSKEIAKAQQAEFEAFRDSVVRPCLQRWRQFCHFFIMELVVLAVAHFGEVRKAHSVMNYQDLLTRAADLLRGNPEVRDYFQKRFTHILIDEFQDTDPIQAEVILFLTGEQVQEQSWRRLTIKPGSLFIVGDPKQSIYRFRRADIDTYNQVKSLIAHSGGVVVPLTTNFRSGPAICRWLNPIFERTFPQVPSDYQPAYEPLDPFVTGPGGVRRITIAKVKGHKAQEIAAVDAERMAAWIDAALQGACLPGLPRDEGRGTLGPGDFLILLRYRANLPIYAGALEARGIPYEISGGGAFGDSEELRDLLHLLRAVAEPEDRIALVGALRGAFYGVSDDLLFRFKQQDGFFSYLYSIDRIPDEGVKEAIGPVFEELQQFRSWAQTKPPSSALGLILDKLGIVPLAVAKEMGETRAGNLLKALELALWESAGRWNSFSEMVEGLARYYHEGDVEGMSVEPGRANAVRLMNLHKAKGLEAEVVFLADPLKDVDHEPDLHIRRAEERTVGYFLAPRRKGEYVKEAVGIPPEWDRYQEIEGRYREAEEDRLLYVAATRAKRLLVVSRYPERTQKGAWKGLGPYLEEVEELEAPEVPQKKTTAGIVTPAEFAGGQKEIAQRFAAVKAATYETAAVTKIAAAAPALPRSGETAGGMSWGRVIHRMLEAAAKDSSVDLELLAENLLVEEGRPVEERALVLATVTGVMYSEVWQRLERAEEAMTEVPFSLYIQEGGLPQVVSGVIDLAFKEADGWVLADYKTDKVNGNLKALVAHYRPQVELYSRFFSDITGERVKEVGLYFVQSDCWVQV